MTPNLPRRSPRYVAVWSIAGKVQRLGVLCFEHDEQASVLRADVFPERLVRIVGEDDVPALSALERLDFWLAIDRAQG